MFLSEKTTKYKEKVRTKSAKMAISEKKFFSRIGLDHIMGIANTHLCAKNQKKLMMESRENAKNFRQLQQGKFGQILYIAILHQYAKFHEKI